MIRPPRSVPLLALALVALVVACDGPAKAQASAPAVSAAVRAGSAPTATCPAPKPSAEVCAAVMTYVRVDGVCCAYPDPCSVPAGPTFTDEACTAPAH